MAYQRECRTLAKHYLKDSEKEAKAYIKLIQQELSCPSDAKRQLDKFVKKLKYIQIIESQVIATQKNTTSGRRKAEQKPSISSYHLQGTVACSLLNKLTNPPGDKDTNSAIPAEKNSLCDKLKKKFFFVNH